MQMGAVIVEDGVSMTKIWAVEGAKRDDGFHSQVRRVREKEEKSDAGEHQIINDSKQI
jgi:hypothetical protein